MTRTNPFIETIVSTDPAVRNRPLAQLAAGTTPAALMAACAELDPWIQDGSRGHVARLAGFA